MFGHVPVHVVPLIYRSNEAEIKTFSKMKNQPTEIEKQIVRERQTEEKRCSSLMMVAHYWQNAYNDALADRISQDDKRAINKAITEAAVMIGAAKDRLNSIKNSGRELTHPLYSMCSHLENMISNIEDIKNRVNKEHMIINLNDYPVIMP